MPCMVFLIRLVAGSAEQDVVVGGEPEELDNVQGGNGKPVE